MPTTIPNESHPGMRLEFVDNWQDAEAQFRKTNEDQDFVFNVGDYDWLNLCLTWTDPPGSGVQNPLNLFLEHTGKHAKWSGNENRLAFYKGTPDSGNNVQVIRINKPAPGAYCAQVKARTILHGPQSFALVVTGAVRSHLAQIGKAH